MKACAGCGEAAVKYGYCRSCLDQRRKELAAEIQRLKMELAKKRDELDQLA